MNTNTRFAVAAHLLTLLSFARKGVVSDLLARSINTNPVVVRRLVGQLKKAGLVRVLPGAGGATLARQPEEISLRDVYLAVRQNSRGRVLNLHADPNRQCFVGRSIHDALAGPLAKAEAAMQEQLAGSSIADLRAFIRARKPDQAAAENK